MKKVYQSEFLEWSNLFFFIPIAIAIFYNIYWYAILMFIMFIVSFDFHFFHEAKQVYYLDVLSSSIIMISNFILLFMAHWVLPYSAFAIAFALIALFFYFRKSKHNHYLNHSLWHVFSAGVCIFCLMTFVYFI
jgi:hypothetical protein